MNGMAGMMGLRLLAPMTGRSTTHEIVPALPRSDPFPEVSAASSGAPASAAPGARRSAVRRPVPPNPHGTEEVDAVLTSQFPWPFRIGHSVRPGNRPALFGRLADTLRRPDRPRTTGLFAGEEATFCTCVAFDIVAFGSRCHDDDLQVFVHRSLYQILEIAFERAGIGWEASHREDRGDGALIIVPMGTAPAALIGPLVGELANCLRLYNKLVADAAQIRLRMAVHSGPVYADANGLVGRCLVHLFRMLEAPEFKRTVAGSGANLGVVASDRLYRDVIEPSRSTMNLGTYRPIEVVLKETRSPAWMHVPGEPPPAELRDLPLPA
jgi:hypothetical protein